MPKDSIHLLKTRVFLKSWKSSKESILRLANRVSGTSLDKTSELFGADSAYILRNDKMFSTCEQRSNVAWAVMCEPLDQGTQTAELNMVNSKVSAMIRLYWTWGPFVKSFENPMKYSSLFWWISTTPLGKHDRSNLSLSSSRLEISSCCRKASAAASARS